MNRLILIGNGFDLAHGLKTSYNDFLKWYLNQALVIAGKSFKYEDILLKVEKTNLAEEIYFDGKVRTEAELIDLFYERGFTELITNKTFQTKGWQNHWETTFVVTVKSILLENLLANCSASRWVDIENEFYLLLKIVLSTNVTKNKEELLQNINVSMAEVIKYLEQYLSQLPIAPAVDGYKSLIIENFKRKDIVLPNLLKEDEFPDQVHILNFNYTQTAAQYRLGKNTHVHSNSIRINHIHGEINVARNPIIFGFGDELDDNYSKMELDITKGFFEYIKSFWYFKTSNYQDLIRFIDAEEFQVYILGHSCGLSDRTMLNMIFEHEQCKSIKFFYHQHHNGDNNYTTLTQEIARHFRNKAVMRKKIVPFDKSSPMPQIIR
ncbi:AbiH family protein [Mucilaginibacter sp.]|uniref:AbiH family protein n=1 Tax=Mucilaginibacter sp. TaxID=1882438 RepID=UPI0025D0935E|nr:AbiH family protein [Mucilaginibacter sp.]